MACKAISAGTEIDVFARTRELHLHRLPGTPRPLRTWGIIQLSRAVTMDRIDALVRAFVPSARQVTSGQAVNTNPAFPTKSPSEACPSQAKEMFG